MDNIYWGRSAAIKQYDQKKFTEFLNLSKNEKERICSRSPGFPKHIVSAEFFGVDFLDKIYLLAKSLKKIHRSNPHFLRSLLSEFSVLNYFDQPSSRTFLSFSSSESLLGLRREEVRDIKTSSTVKGETDKDALRTISSYFDAIVCRHSSDIFHWFSIWVMLNSDREIPIINAGCGKAEHPTQALLDYFTIKESFNGSVDGLKIGFVGDCLRGRTVHSLSKVLSKYEDITITFIAPENLQIDTDTLNFLKNSHTNLTIQFETSSLGNVIGEFDVIYMTRVQDEHGGPAEYPKEFSFQLDNLNEMKSKSILMHPMPKREEMDPALDYLHRDPRIMYWRQQRNGMWVRAALFAYLFNKDDSILDLS